MNFNILEVIISVFFTALVVSVLFRKLKLSIVLGYLIVGALVGPHGLGLVADSDDINNLADFGVVFLMFTVGLEFSIPKLFALRSSVFFIGGLQVLGCLVFTTLIGHWLGMSLLAGLAVGSIVAMSSTAIVVKQLHDQFELQTHHSLSAIGILLFQDLAVVPLMILITSLAKGAEHGLSNVLLLALLKGVLAILLIFLMGRWLLRPLFHLIAKTRAIELFTLSVLLVTLTSAWLTQTLGLSYAFGAFLAGMMLGETEYRHQIEVEIRPFRDMLLALFFISVGMLSNFQTWKATWFWIALLVSALIFAKLILIYLLSRLAGNSNSMAIRTGIVLAQGGEFGFAILDLAMDNNILSPEYQQVVLAALLISIAIAPLLIRYNKQISDLLLGTNKKLSESDSQHKIIDHAKKMKRHVVICGYGRVGQHIARMLDKIHFPYIGIDADADLVQKASLAGDEVIYGEASHPEILLKAGVDHAKVLIISLSDHRAALKILSIVRSHFPDLPVLVRCKDKRELKQLKKIGATQIIAELFEVSLTLSNHLLQIIKLPRAKIAEIIQDVRNTDYDLLQKVFEGSEQEDAYQGDPLSLHEQLCPIVITADAYAIGKELRELHLKELGVEVISIRRNDEKHLKPHGNVVVEANDIVVLFGTLSNLEDAERRLLEG